jgi:uncharacterized protein (DUF362 family)
MHGRKRQASLTKLEQGKGKRLATINTTGTAWIQTVNPAPHDIALALERGLESVGRSPSPDERWAIKLNLTYPTYLPGVVNAPAFVEGLCLWARERRVRLTFVEGDGGNGVYSAQDAFDGNGVTDLARRYGMLCASLSEKPWDWRETNVQGRAVRLPYSPFFRRREYDRFVTAPLFKNHIFTTVTLGMKNLWGCIPDAYRMYYHHLLDFGIVALYKELRPDLSIFDGLVAMRGRGPMEGEALAMNAIMTCSDVGVGEAAALHIMGVPMHKVRHLALALAEGLMPASQEVSWLNEVSCFCRSDFILERSALNHLSIWLAKWPGLQRLVYHSRISGAFYAVVNRLRGNSAQTRLFHDKRVGLYSSIPLKDRGADY